jgi:uncharacterized membrane protein
MTMDRKRTLLAVAGACALLAVARPISADIRVLTHDAADLAPHRVQTALNLGVVALDVLITWTDRVHR